ncbi:MAG: hypothetical protein ACLUGF_14070 [Clostridium sp.]
MTNRLYMNLTSSLPLSINQWNEVMIFQGYDMSAAIKPCYSIRSVKTFRTTPKARDDTPI